MLRLLFAIVWGILLAGTLAGAPVDLYVDPAIGDDTALGTQSAPVKTLYGAVNRIPLQIKTPFIIHLTGGEHPHSGSAAGALELRREMHEGAFVRILGDGEKPVLNWQAGDGPMVNIADGTWEIENVKLGTRGEGQTIGFRVSGPAVAKLKGVRIHTAGFARAGIHATRGGVVELSGTIELNEDLHDENPEDLTFSRIEADYFGVVKFAQREGASLSIGNGSLCASYYGVIELGCSSARITSWHDQANTIAVNDSGRVDFHSTPSTLTAKNHRNTPIGLEHDGHVLAEGAPITIIGNGNGNAIVLQKASTFFCNDVTLQGSFNVPLSCMSDSTMLVGIIGDLDGGEVMSGAIIIVEKITGELTKPINIYREGRLVLPEEPRIVIR